MVESQYFSIEELNMLLKPVHIKIRTRTQDVKSEYGMQYGYESNKPSLEEFEKNYHNTMAVDYLGTSYINAEDLIKKALGIRVLHWNWDDSGENVEIAYIGECKATPLQMAESTEDALVA